LLTALSAAANGDFSARVAVDGYSGVMRQIAQKFNRMAELNEALTDEITRVERVVRREGRMTETASLRGVTGGWSQIVSSVNSLISGLVQPSTEVARVISAVADGDLTQKMAMELDGQPVKGEFLRIGRTVNAMASNLTGQVRNIAQVTAAVANGDLSKKITVDVKGEILELKNTINRMVDQLNSFASEVTRVAREVGTVGKLGGQAQVQGVSGIWKDLTDGSRTNSWPRCRTSCAIR
jgi:HAMP domain-containing protein